MFENKKIMILGMARSGYEVAKLLSKLQNQILATDMKDQEKEKIEDLKSWNIDYITTDAPEKILDETYDYVIKNPAIRKDHPCVLKAKELKIPVINEVEVAYHFLPQEKTIIGITGSNGKTTTTTITYELLKAQGLPVHLAGNIGIPLSAIVNDFQKNDILVMEISDHQLMDMYDFKTDISVLTNLSEVHIDFHGTYDNYKNTKKKIFNHHTKADVAILNLENKDVLDLTHDIPSQKEYFSSKQKTDIYIKDTAIYNLDEKIIELDKIRIKGTHNYENIMCAISVAKKYNVTNETIEKVLSNFKGVEHRLEYVTTKDTVEFYNDSKATNVESTIIALDSFDKTTCLILGGLDRGHSFEGLNSHVKHVKQIVCYGETKERIKAWAETQNIPCHITGTLEQATKYAWQNKNQNSVILLSPACASWDQYKRFEDRGDEFKKIVNELV